MNRFTIWATALAALVMAGSSAEAACKMSHVSNKTFMIAATDAGGVLNALFYCRFVTSASGTVALTPNGCALYNPKVTNFQTPVMFDLISGSLVLVPGGSCTYDLELSLLAPSTNVMKARIVMESGKTTGTGNWISNFNAFGSVSLMRQ